ncbi:hypothetical protein [Robiginitalea sediminis]|uniref:hypothetical protein n=1 Tax=Robiginitalea sediminis TaxID=1982593 RepID=UPI000B4B3033|nr:hypothetical protein [Robiginitalea sediminis]
MKQHSFSLLLALFLGSFLVQAQDCTLGIGGRDTDMIIAVFELDSVQQSRLSQWTKELEAVNTPLEEKARILLDTHPQKSDEDLAALGQKFDVLKQEMIANATRFDRLLLGTFNEAQYERYAQLCREVYRAPMAPLRQE